MSGLIWIQSIWHPNCIEKKSIIQRVKYDTIIKYDGVIETILENPKADQNTLFHRYMYVLLANDIFVATPHF